MKRITSTKDKTTTRGETRYLSAAEVGRRYGVHANTIWRWAGCEKIGFPAPKKLTPQTTRWSEAALDAWDASREAAA